MHGRRPRLRCLGGGSERGAAHGAAGKRRGCVMGIPMGGIPVDFFVGEEDSNIF